MAVFYSQNRPNTNKNKTHKVSTPKVPSQRRSTPLEPNFHKRGCVNPAAGSFAPTPDAVRPDSKPLLTSDFWVMPIYKELLYSGSRPLQDRSSELKRPAPGLVKIVCQAEAGDEPEELVDNSKGPRVGTRQYLNAVSPIQLHECMVPCSLGSGCHGGPGD